MTVIDVTTGQRLAGQTVVIAGNRIQAMGPANHVRLPKGTQQVDARDKYLMPGLWDMHVRVDEEVGFYPRFIAFGVTGIREMLQHFRPGASAFRLWQRDVRDGSRIGPRSVGPSAGNYWLGLQTEDVPRVVDSLKAAGEAFFVFDQKYPDMRDLYLTILRETRRVGLPVIGDIPPDVTGVEASDIGGNVFPFCRCSTVSVFRHFLTGSGIQVDLRRRICGRGQGRRRGSDMGSRYWRSWCFSSTGG